MYQVCYEKIDFVSACGYRKFNKGTIAFSMNPKDEIGISKYFYGYLRTCSDYLGELIIQCRSSNMMQNAI